MAGFDESAVVQIYEGEQALGSGYALGNGRVLTARHVVGERGKVWVRSKGQSEGFAMEVAWRGAAHVAEHDVAILRSASSGPLKGEPSVAWFAGDPRKQDWFARGFPAALGNASVAVSGEIEEGQDAGSNPCQLSVKVAPGTADLWKGMSGAAVFVEQRLFAVLRTASGYFGGQSVAAVRVAALVMSDETLREAVGLPPPVGGPTQWRSDVHDELVRILESTMGLRECLARAGDPWKAQAAKGNSALATAMLDEASPAELIDELQGAMSWLEPGDDGSRLADAMLSLLEHALPVVGGPHTSMMRLDTGAVWVTNAKFDCMVEARMAYGDQRNADWPAWWSTDELPKPRAHIPAHGLDIPEGGTDGLQRVGDMARSLVDRTDPIAAVGRVESMARRVVMDEDARRGKGLSSRDEYIVQARAIVKRAAKKQSKQPPLTFYTILDEAAEGDGLPLIATLIDRDLGVRVIVPRMQSADYEAMAAFRASLSALYETYRTVTRRPLP